MGSSGARSTWPIVEKDRLVDAVASSLTTDARSGVLITGHFGLGKTGTVAEALSRLGSNTPVVRVQGTFSPGDLEYGALSSLLTELEPADLSCPARVLAALTQRVRDTPGEGTPIVFIDNGDELDAASATVLAQLARNGIAKLAITCENLSSFPSELTDLWHDGNLERFPLRPLSEAETGVLLNTALGITASASAVQRLHEECGGNPRYLQTLAEEQMARGNLVENDGLWCLVSTDIAVGRSSVELALMRLGRLSPSHRETVEILALALTLPLEVLSQLSGPEAIETLEDGGLIQVTAHNQPEARIAEPFIGKAIRASLPMGRRSHFRTRLIENCAPVMPPPADLRAFALWTLESGTTLTPDIALAGARRANDSGAPSDALRILEAVPQLSSDPRAVNQQARALSALRKWDEARAVLQGHVGTDSSSDLEMGQWADVQLLGSSIERFLPGGAPQAGVALAETRATLADALSGPRRRQVADVRELFEKVELADAGLAGYQGRYREICRRLETPLVFGAREDSVFQLILDCRLSDAYAHTGRAATGIELAADAVTRLQVVRPSSPVVKLAHTSLFISYLLAGQWPEGHAALDARTGNGEPSSEIDASLAELARGLLYAYGGQPKQALEFLIPANKQLTVWQMSDLAGLGSAAEAYSYALLEDADQARLAFDAAQRCSTHQMAWSVRRSQLHFMALATARLNSRDRAVEQLLQLADEDERAGTLSHELFALSAVVRLGHTEAAARLAHRAGQAQGAFAELCRLYGTGIDTGAGEMLIEAARRAAEVGNELFSADAASAVLNLPEPDDEHVRAAERLLRERNRPDSLVNYDVVMQGLTKREREIAQLTAAGTTTREIATQLTVSMRTVEGHRYQISKKLQLTGRDGLASGRSHGTTGRRRATPAHR